MIICSGDALIDMLPTRLADGSEAFRPVPGGAVFNTAVALGRLGEEAGFFSALSSDMFGEKLVSYLANSGVDTTYCARSPNPTTLAFVTLKDGNPQYHFVDENTAGRMLGIEALPSLPDTVQAVHFGGISLIPEPCGSTFEELMRRMREAAVISLDPNIRPGFVVDEAGYRERLRRMIGMSDVIKVSEEDLAWLAPDGKFERIARDWIEGGASVVILTRGDKGTRAITPSVDLTVPATHVSVVDTVGAGDSFNAGFLASLRLAGALSKPMLRTLGRPTLQTALEFASRVAAYTVTQAGANPPWRKDLQDGDGLANDVFNETTTGKLPADTR